MKVVRVDKYGDPAVLQLIDIPPPVPREHEVVVQVVAVGVSFDDVLDRIGETERELPFIPGSEVAGTIAAVGSQVTGWRVGQRVTCVAPSAYAEQAVAPQEHVVPIPEGMTFAQAAMGLRDGIHAHALITMAATPREGDIVLVRPATQGPGLCLIQLAKQRSAHVIAVVATRESEPLARRLGADAVVVWKPAAAVVEDISCLTGGAGVQVVFDAVGNAVDPVAVEWELDCLRLRGHLVLFGRAPLSVGLVNFDRLAGASLTVTSAVAPDYFVEAGTFARSARLMFDQMARGALEIPLAGAFPLSEAARAHHLAESPACSGKVILLP